VNIFPVLGIVLSVILGGAATITSSMVLFNLRSMNKRIELLETRQQSLYERKNICHQDFVNKVDYIRSITSFESSLKKLVESVSELKGSMKAIEQMPQICGSIAQMIVKEMQ